MVLSTQTLLRNVTNSSVMLLLLITLCALSAGHEVARLLVPLHADPRRAAELSCQFRMHGQRLHSVKWYRDLHEIFRYNPEQQPQIRLFNVSGVAVQGGWCEPERCVVRVMPQPRATRAAYTCEVSAEGPMFQIARQTKHMTVVAMPEKDPVITGPSVARPGEQLRLNCSTDYSLPPSDVHWYLDDRLQEPSAAGRAGLSAARAGGLRAAWRELRARVPDNASDALRARCDAVLPVEPPVLRTASTAVLVSSRTQLYDKYVSNGGADACWAVAAAAAAWGLALASRGLSL